jgi:hypothetical protein
LNAGNSVDSSHGELDALTQRALNQLDGLNSRALNATTCSIILSGGLLTGTVYWAVLMHKSVWAVLLLSGISLVLCICFALQISSLRVLLAWQRATEAALKERKPGSFFKVMLLEEVRSGKNRIKIRYKNTNYPKRTFPDVVIFPQTLFGTPLGHEFDAAVYFDPRWPSKALAIRLQNTVLLVQPSPTDLVLRAYR